MELLPENIKHILHSDFVTFSDKAKVIYFLGHNAYQQEAVIDWFH